jgi:hypothetical protein
MIKSVRIKKVESMIINEWIANNKNKMIEPITQSELIHVLISCGLQRLHIDELGEMVFSKSPKSGQG